MFDHLYLGHYAGPVELVPADEEEIVVVSEEGAAVYRHPGPELGEFVRWVAAEEEVRTGRARTPEHRKGPGIFGQVERVFL